ITTGPSGNSRPVASTRIFDIKSSHFLLWGAGGLEPDPRATFHCLWLWQRRCRLPSKWGLRCREGSVAIRTVATRLFATRLGRCVVLGRRVSLLGEIVSHFLLRGLKIYDALLQARHHCFQCIDLPIGGIDLLLMICREPIDGVLQKVDVALQAAGAPLHGLFDRA